MKSLEQLVEETTIPENYYPVHLAEVDKTHNVVTTENISNTQNILLVNKGARITQNIAQNLLKHKLVKPIEQQIKVEQCLQKESLFEQFELILQKYPDLKLIHETTGFQKAFKILVKSYIVSPIITQKLTVFSQQLPLEFEKTLICTLLAVNIAYSAKLTQEKLITTYLAGLCHDLGLLHISPDTFSHKDKLTIQQWRGIKTHIITGYLFVNNIGGAYKEVAKAILEHHERSDGTGYPIGKNEKQLGIIGQIIGIADSLQALRTNQFDKVGRTIHHALPFLKMNPDVYTEKVYRSTVAMITAIPDEPEPVNSFNNIEELVKHLISRGEQLGNASLLVRLLFHYAEELELQKHGQNMLRVLSPFEKMIKQSGLVEDHIFKWLEYVTDSKNYSPLKELCELELMQNELYWQLKKARYSYSNFLEQEPNAGSKELMLHLIKISAEIDSFL